MKLSFVGSSRLSDTEKNFHFKFKLE